MTSLSNKRNILMEKGEIKMKEFEYKEITKTEKILKGIVCNECKTEINKANGFSFYYEVTTHHDHWGNDSGDSYRYGDLCSIECLTKNMTEYYENKSNDSGYFYDIETEIVTQ